MNNQFEKMQKLAFGKAITENNPQSLTESSLKDKIKELVHSSLGEAKKKKKKEADVAPQEDIIDMGMNMDTPSDTIAPASTDEIDIDPKVKTIQDSLSKALANAKALGDEKLVNQIGNTITMLVRTQVVGQQVAESLNEDENSAVVQSYLAKLENFKSNYTDDIYDLKNLLTAIDIFRNSLANEIKKDTEGLNEIQGDPEDFGKRDDGPTFNPNDYADDYEEEKGSNAVVKHYVELLKTHMDDIYDLYNLMAAVEIIKKDFGVKQ